VQENWTTIKLRGTTDGTALPLVDTISQTVLTVFVQLCADGVNKWPYIPPVVIITK